MASDRKIAGDIERLNAMLDGELPPAEHAALADRIAADRDLAQAYATLARLKACIVETAANGSPLELPPSRPKSRLLPAFGIAAAAAAVLLAVVTWYPQYQADEAPTVSIAPLVTLASLPATPIVPDLTNAGLMLVGAEVERSGETAVLVTAYRGPRGCRLELRVRPVAVDLPPTAGTSRRAWTAGALAYELVAFGMPAGRFAAVAEAAEAATRAGQMPRDADTRLRQASLQAPPCVG